MSHVVCAECKSPDVQLMAWVDPNTNEVIDDVGPWEAKDYNYCNECDCPVPLTRADISEAK